MVIGELPPEAETVAAETASACGSRLYRSGELCGEDADPQYIASRADLRSSCQVRNIRTVMTSLYILGAWDAASTEALRSGACSGSQRSPGQVGEAFYEP